MDELDMLCAETFLEKQDKLFDEPVAETVSQAMEFLEDCYAQVFDTVDDIREYWEDNGIDAAGMDDEAIEDALEVFKLPNGKFLLVEA